MELESLHLQPTRKPAATPRQRRQHHGEFCISVLPQLRDVSVDAVLFDLDGTLIDHRSAAAAAVTATFLGKPQQPVIDQDLVTRRWLELEATMMDRYLAGELTFIEQRRLRIARLAEELGLGSWTTAGLSTSAPARCAWAPRFFEGGYHLDVAELLSRHVVLEIENIGSDTDKAFFIGAILIRVFEHLRVHRTTTPTALHH
ncbi:hypothetical protein [Nocardia asiatica]|uniref:hypothetical protein n=1 Tax=Nocardia asiatica TaxID=209252 RepID=UPI003EE25184